MPNDPAHDYDIDPRVERGYHEEADLYEAVVEPVFRPALEDLLDRAHLQPGERVLDVGSGPGLLALLAAERVGPKGHVLGVDVAEGMVRVASERAASLPHITFERADANATHLVDGSFDAALSSFALHFTDPSRSLRELHRVLRSQSGRLLAVLPGLTWGLSEAVAAAISAERARLLPPDAAEWAADVDHTYERAIARWALLSTDVLEARLRQLDFGQIVYQRASFPFAFSGPRAVWEWYYAGVGLRRFLSGWPADRQAAFHAEMSSAVAGVLGDHPLTLEWDVIRLQAAK